MSENQSQISIKFEATPNPATMKFILSKQILDESFDCLTAQEAERSPLAAKIFGFPWTNAVFLGPDYVSITKQDWVDWDILAEPLAQIIQEHIQSGRPVVNSVHRGAAGNSSGGDTGSDEDLHDSPVVKKIKSVLNGEVRPVAQMDGGDIRYLSFQDGVLLLQFKGACSGCPSSQATLKNFVEVRIRELIPEVTEVIAE